MPDNPPPAGCHEIPPDQIFGGQFFSFAVTPFFADAFMQKFRKRLRQPVGQCLGHDGVVIIVVRLELFHQLLQPVPAGHPQTRLCDHWMLNVSAQQNPPGTSSARCCPSGFADEGNGTSSAPCCAIRRCIAARRRLPGSPGRNHKRRAAVINFLPTDPYPATFARRRKVCALPRRVSDDSGWPDSVRAIPRCERMVTSQSTGRVRPMTLVGDDVSESSYNSFPEEQASSRRLLRWNREPPRR